MSVTVVGAVYNVPELDLLVLLNEATGSAWDANAAKIAAVTPVEVDGVITSIKVSVETN